MYIEACNKVTPMGHGHVWCGVLISGGAKYGILAAKKCPIYHGLPTSGSREICHWVHNNEEYVNVLL